MNNKVVLDANVLIQYVEAEHVRHLETVDYLANIDGLFIVNNVTLSEVLVGAVRSHVSNVVLRSILGDLGAEIFDGVGETWSLLFAQTRANAVTKISTPDAIVLATALAIGGNVATFDNGLAKAAQAKHALYVPKY